MDEAKAQAGLRGHFGAAVDDQAIMTECLSILRLYALPASELFYKFEAYLLSHPTPPSAFKPGQPAQPKLTLEIARELKKEFQRDVAAKNVAGVRAPTGAGRAATTPGVASAGGVKKRMSGVGLDGLLDFDPTTPAAKRVRPSLGGSSAGQTTPRAVAPAYDTPTRPGQATPTNGGTFSSPLFVPSAPEIRPTPTTNKFIARTNALVTTDTLNPHLSRAPAQAVPSGSKRPRIALSTQADPKNYAYRYMFEKVSERAEVIDSRINSTATLIRTAYALNDDFADPSESTGAEEVYTVGQIHADSSNSKLNDQSLLLQTSRLIGAGARVPLRFSKHCVVRGGPPGVAGVGFFVGGVWGFKGRNGSGEWFEVTEILVPPLPDMPGDPATELLEYSYGTKLAGSPSAIVTASGPFTLDADLDYAPFDALIEEIKRSRPDVVILMGPFVSSAHPLIKAGAITQTPAEIFRSRITDPLLSVLELNPACNIILVPSVRDLVGSSVCFPQGMFDKADVGTASAKRIRLLPNPCVLNINEVSVAVSSVDSLFQLRKDMFFKRAVEAEPEAGAGPGGQGDIIANVCRSILTQRTFYPLYPVPKEAAQDVNLDLTHHSLLALGQLPDILILPSQLTKFAKVVDSVVVVNPGRLSQFSSGGTFAKLAVHPMDKDKLVSAASAGGIAAEAMEHDVFERCRVDIVRI